MISMKCKRVQFITIIKCYKKIISNFYSKKSEIMKRSKFSVFSSLSKRVLLCIFLIVLSSNFFNIQKVKGNLFHEELFEPLNSVIMAESTEIMIPFIAGWICDDDNTLSLQDIDIYAIHGENKDYIDTYVVGEPLFSCYMDEYMDLAGETYYVKNVEPTCEYDENTQTYYISYKDTLKEAIGYAQGSEPQEDWFDFNSITLNKVYNSMADSEMILLNMEDLFTQFEADQNYVIVLAANFLMDGTNTISIEREVTIYTTFGNQQILKQNQLSSGGFDRRFRSDHSFYKGDGHVHSIRSDGKKKLNHSYYGEQDEITQDERIKQLLTITHYRREKNDCDWVIMTDHADYFWPGQKPGKGTAWFNLYNNESCFGLNSAESVERMESDTTNYKSYYAVIPAEEATVRATETACYDLSNYLTMPRSDILNLYGPHDGYQYVHRIPNWSLNGTDYVKNNIADMCGYTDVGPNGWCILAHPSNTWIPWRLFPTIEDHWTNEWNSHPSPSVIRSYGDTDESNNGFGVMGMEVFCNKSHDTAHWDKYLYYDLNQTLNYWNIDSFKNNFVVGVGNSDSHCWEYLVEDLTALKSFKNTDCSISEAEIEIREVPYFEDMYWYAQFTTFMMGHGFSFVYIENYDGSHSKLVRSLRSCGEYNKGVSFSDYGSFVTFSVNNIPSGGKVENLGETADIHIQAYPLVKDYGLIEEVWVLAKGEGDSTNPRVLYHDSNILSPVLNISVVIPATEILQRDYIRVLVKTYSGNILPFHDYACANPVFIIK